MSIEVKRLNQTSVRLSEVEVEFLGGGAFQVLLDGKKLPIVAEPPATITLGDGSMFLTCTLLVKPKSDGPKDDD